MESGFVGLAIWVSFLGEGTRGEVDWVTGGTGSGVEESIAERIFVVEWDSSVERISWAVETLEVMEEMTDECDFVTVEERWSRSEASL